MLRIPFLSQECHGQTSTFTVRKNSGDHTENIYDNLSRRQQSKRDRSYGHMILEEGQENQVWIVGGGIGLPPFISLTSVNILF